MPVRRASCSSAATLLGSRTHSRRTGRTATRRAPSAHVRDRQLTCERTRRLTARLRCHNPVRTTTVVASPAGVTGKIASLGGHTLSSSAATASGDAPAAAAAAAAGTAAGAETGAPAEAPRVPQAELDRLRRERYQALQEQAERERQRREKAAKRAAAEAALARLGRPGGGYKLGQLDTYDRA